MGYGDQLLAAGAAERIFRDDPRRGPVVITSPTGKPRWSSLWAGNPAVYCPDPPPPPQLRRIVFGGTQLPYYPPVDTPEGRRWPTGWRVRDHRPILYRTYAEIARGHAIHEQYGNFILLEPTGLDRKSPNRAWTPEKWQALADQVRAAVPYPILQLDRPEAQRLDGVIPIPHASFRDACAILAWAHLFVGTEGGLQIAAGTLRVPAVILMSPCGPPVDVIGFPEHSHIVDADPQTPCGYLTRCDHCAAAWDRLSPETVVATMQQVIR